MARNKVLVVDDEKNQREIYTLILGDDGYQVTTAQSGEQALRFAAENSFDLVLTDYKMAGMDGLTLLNELLKLDPSIIVVMMTAHGSVESVKEALRGGAFDYLEKPIDRDQLLKVVQNALGRLNRIDDEIIGQSEEMERVKKMILKVAGSSSTVMIRSARLRLIFPMIAASVVDLPDPVVPETTTIPRWNVLSSSICGGRFSSSNIGIFAMIRRIVIASFSRLWKMLVRKRAMPGTLYATSTDPLCSRMCFFSAGSPCEVKIVSTYSFIASSVGGGQSRNRARPSTRIIGALPA